MKKIITILLAAAAVAAAAVSCQKSTTPTYTVTVKVAADTTFPATAEDPVYTVKLTNTAGGAVSEAETENGIAVFSGVYSGVYTITASASAVIGNDTYNLSASFDESKSILKDETFEMTATAVKASNLIFKEIYQCGCKNGEDGTGSYFRDQYYEIYNNGETTMYADSLCIAECAGYNWDYSVKYNYIIEDADDYVFSQFIWQIPGDGDDYPIKPGESIIICQLAQNHADTLSNSDLTSPYRSPVNLLGGDFEAITGETTAWTGQVLHDGPAINMTPAVAAYSMPQWLTSTGNAAMVLFKPSKPLSSENMIISEESDSQYNAVREILISDIYDAVNLVEDDTRLTTLILPTSLDAGCIWVTAPGTYTGESISRKVADTRADGTKIYQDTNNTTDDFELNTTPELRRNGAGVPSWNTWNQ